MELAKECRLEMPGEANVKKVYDKGMEAGMGGDDLALDLQAGPRPLKRENRNGKLVGASESGQ